VFLLYYIYVYFFSCFILLRCCAVFLLYYIYIYIFSCFILLRCCAVFYFICLSFTLYKNLPKIFNSMIFTVFFFFAIYVCVTIYYLVVILATSVSRYILIICLRITFLSSLHRHRLAFSTFFLLLLSFHNINLNQINVGKIHSTKILVTYKRNNFSRSANFCISPYNFWLIFVLLLRYPFVIFFICL
jgi:hypothetical protein